MTQKIQNIDIDGASYPVADFSDEVKNLVAVRERWGNDLQQLEGEILNTRVALNAVDNQLAALVKAELEARAAISAANDAQASDAPVDEAAPTEDTAAPTV